MAQADRVTGSGLETQGRLTVVPRGTWASIARVYWWLVTLVGAATLVASLFFSATWPGSGGALNGISFTLSHFTVWSNILVLVTNAQLAANPARDGPWFRWLRMTSLVMITITAIVYVTVLAPLGTPHGPDVWTNAGYHYVCPLATIAGFLLFGPRPRLTIREVGTMLVIPILWPIYTLLRGLLLLRPPGSRPIDYPGPPQHWYPGAFVDVNNPSPLIPGLNLGGYAGVATNVGVIVVLGVVVAFIFLGLDRLLSGGRKPSK